MTTPDDTTGKRENDMSDVKVKALEWDNQGRAICLLGLYLVDIWHAGEGLWRWKGPNGKWKISNGHWTEEDAKAAAQADYETRILSALEPPHDRS